MTRLCTGIALRILHQIYPDTIPERYNLKKDLGLSGYCPHACTVCSAISSSVADGVVGGCIFQVLECLRREGLGADSVRSANSSECWLALKATSVVTASPPLRLNPYNLGA